MHNVPNFRAGHFIQATPPSRGADEMKFVCYLIYTLVYETLVLGGTGYAVFVLGHSGWWFLLAALFSCGQYSPAKFYGIIGDDEQQTGEG